MTDRDTVPWRSFAVEAERRLRDAGFPSPETDARRIVERAAGVEGAEYAMALDEPATQRSVHFFDAMLERRLTGEPLQYVLGSWGFRQLDLFVDRRVLIPRPETEIVVEYALAEIDRVRADSGDGPVLVVDLGTGSGAIALSTAIERERVEVWATDVSPDALAVARANLAGIGRRAAAVRLAEGHWFEALPSELAGIVDVIVSNPPYVAADDDLPAEVADWEPPGALVSGPTGTEALELLIDEAPRWLTPVGALVLELAPHQAAAMQEHARRRGFGDVRTEADLTGRDRVLVARQV